MWVGDCWKNGNISHRLDTFILWANIPPPPTPQHKRHLYFSDSHKHIPVCRCKNGGWDYQSCYHSNKSKESVIPSNNLIYYLECINTRKIYSQSLISAEKKIINIQVFYFPSHRSCHGTRRFEIAIFGGNYETFCFKTTHRPRPKWITCLLPLRWVLYTTDLYVKHRYHLHVLVFNHWLTGICISLKSCTNVQRLSKIYKDAYLFVKINDNIVWGCVIMIIN